MSDINYEEYLGAFKKVMEYRTHHLKDLKLSDAPKVIVYNGKDNHLAAKSFVEYMKHFPDESHIIAKLGLAEINIYREDTYNSIYNKIKLTLERNRDYQLKTLDIEPW